MARLKYWMGDPPEVCDLNSAHKITTTFIDGATRRGPWANMCPDCYRTEGRGLGTGYGQKYEKQEIDGEIKWVKTGG